MVRQQINPRMEVAMARFRQLLIQWAIEEEFGRTYFRFVVRSNWVAMLLTVNSVAYHRWLWVVANQVVQFRWERRGTEGVWAMGCQL